MLLSWWLYSSSSIAFSKSHVIKLIGSLILHEIHNFDKIACDFIFNFTCKLTFLYPNFHRRAYRNWIVIIDSIYIVLIPELIIVLRTWGSYVMAFVPIVDIAIPCVSLVSRFCYINLLIAFTLLQRNGKKFLYGLLLVASSRPNTRVITVIKYRFGYLGLAREVSLFFVFLVLSHHIS